MALPYAHLNVSDAVKRLIAFEMQLGPFAVAQLRILAEIVDLTGGQPKTQPRMFVTSTLGSPNDDGGWIPNIFGVIAKSRKVPAAIRLGSGEKRMYFPPTSPADVDSLIAGLNKLSNRAITA
jgi:hypothetical protein